MRTFHMLHSNKSPILTDTTYSYRKHGKLPWLQKILFAILDKLGCGAYYTETFNYETIAIEDVLERVVKNYHNLQLIHEIRPKYLVLGRNYYADLLRHEYGMQYIQLPSNYRQYGVKPHDMFMGMKIILVPWMEGMVILPEIDRGY